MKNQNEDRESSYKPGDHRDIEIRVHRAGAIGNLHVPTGSIVFDREWPESTHLSLEALGERFNEEATQIADVLISILPGGTLDRLMCALLAYKASHYVVNHETPRGRTPSIVNAIEQDASLEFMVGALMAVKASSEWSAMEAATQELVEHALDGSWKR
jgi:hypothetical protein